MHYSRYVRHGDPLGGKSYVTKELRLHPAYGRWDAMMQRCYNKNNRWFLNYGGRGIEVCERWHKSENFIADMGVPPKGMTLDRIDNDKGYSPENCKWSTRKEQMNNTSKTIKFHFKNEEHTITSFCEKYKLKRSTVDMRLRRNLNPLTGRREK